MYTIRKVRYIFLVYLNHISRSFLLGTKVEITIDNSTTDDVSRLFIEISWYMRRHSQLHCRYASDTMLGETQTVVDRNTHYFDAWLQFKYMNINMLLRVCSILILWIFNLELKTGESASVIYRMPYRVLFQHEYRLISLIIWITQSYQWNRVISIILCE